MENVDFPERIRYSDLEGRHQLLEVVRVTKEYFKMMITGNTSNRILLITKV